MRIDPRSASQHLGMAGPAITPVVDLAGDQADDQADVARRLVAAARDHGFVYVRDPGGAPSPAAVAQAFALASRPPPPPRPPRRR